MADMLSQDRAAQVKRAVVGAALVIAGLLGLAVLIYISNARGSAAEAAMMRLGLAGSALASAVAQALLFFGGWLLWRARPRRRP